MTGRWEKHIFHPVPASLLSSLLARPLVSLFLHTSLILFLFLIGSISLLISTLYMFTGKRKRSARSRCHFCKANSLSSSHSDSYIPLVGTVCPSDHATYTPGMNTSSAPADLMHHCYSTALKSRYTSPTSHPVCLSKMGSETILWDLTSRWRSMSSRVCLILTRGRGGASLFLDSFLFLSLSWSHSPFS